jgi:hypothetical protein
MYVDAFPPLKGSPVSITTVMFCILNLSPKERYVKGSIYYASRATTLRLEYLSILFLSSYKSENIIVVCVSAGCTKPSDIFSFLLPSLKDILVLEKIGLTITARLEQLKFKARICVTIGDIPGMAELCKHSGHTSFNGCRICKIVGRTVARSMCFSNIVENKHHRLEHIQYQKRTKEDYKVKKGVCTVIQTFSDL